jgi:hypothetical protein
MKYFTPDGIKAYSDEAKRQLPADWTWSLYRFHPADQEVYLVRHVVAGAIAELEAEMHLTTVPAQVKETEFARLDCATCHAPAVGPVALERQRAGDEFPKPAKAAALVRVVAAHAEGLPGLAPAAKDFGAKWDSVERAFAVRPYGSSPLVASAAGDIVRWCQDFLARLDSAGPVYSRVETRRLLVSIGDAAVSSRWASGD